MRRVWVVVAALLMAVTAGTFGPSYAVADKDCGDFATQKAAQLFFLDQGGPARDPHRLDSDGDGIACETLPCPCYTGTQSPDGGGGGKATRVVQRARIVKVVDGDTVNVRLASGKRRSVRLIGIDTPEHGRCGAGQATKSLRAMAPVGTRVRLVSDPTQALRDRYDRLLRYVVRRSDRRDLNRAQVHRGWAKVYVYGGVEFERVRGYRKAQRSAKAGPRGIWRTCR